MRAARRRRLAEQQGGARRRVDLVLVMHLENLDIEILAKARRHLLDQCGEQIDAETHIAGFDDAGMARRRLDLGVARLVDAGGADHMHDARLRREFGERQRRLRHGEIDNAVDAGEERSADHR